MKLNARTSDVSRTGCYIDSLNPMPAGTLIRVKLTQGGEEVEVRGTVMYVSPGLGMGVAFEENIPQNQRVILDC
jgi:PilZ domain